MPPSAAARLAWSAFLVSLVLAALSAVFQVLNRAAAIPGHPYWASNAVGAVTFGLLGALVASHRPDHRIGWLFCAAGLLSAVGVFAGEYGPYTAMTMETPETQMGGAVAMWVGNWSWWLVFIPLLLMLLLFPTGRLPSRRWRRAAWAGSAGVALAAAGDALMPGPMRLMPSPNPLGIAGAAGVLDAFRFGGGVLLMSVGLAAVASLLRRLRRAQGVERQQLKWFAYAGGLSIALLVGAIVADARIGVRALGPLAGTIGFSILLPTAVAVAVLRHGLWDVDVLINRTLVYGALTAGVVALYAFVVGSLGALFQASGSPSASLVAAALVAVLFQPLRARLQRGVNRVLYGERDEPYAVVSRLGRRLEGTLAPDAVLPAIVQTLTESLKLPYAAIALRQGEGLAVAAARGTPGSGLLHLPLVYQGEMVGELRLGPRAPGETFGPTDRRLLEDLARQTGVAAHAVRLTAHLQEARERLVTAREEERRRLRRDLHDGLGPVLASQTLTLEAARRLVERDPAAAGALLDDLLGQTKDAVADVRRLVYALRPPALDDLGLVSALREQAAQYGYAGPHITIEVQEPLPPLPAAVEVAAYRIVQEALTNVLRHADARACTVHLALAGPSERPALRLEVRDDGRGLPVSGRTGVGTASMRERAEELGGTCEIASPAGGGTRVRAWLPLQTDGPWTASGS